MPNAKRKSPQAGGGAEPPAPLLPAGPRPTSSSPALGWGLCSQEGNSCDATCDSARETKALRICAASAAEPAPAAALEAPAGCGAGGMHAVCSVPLAMLHSYHAGCCSRLGSSSSLSELDAAGSCGDLAAAAAADEGLGGLPAAEACGTQQQQQQQQSARCCDSEGTGMPIAAAVAVDAATAATAAEGVAAAAAAAAASPWADPPDDILKRVGPRPACWLGSARSPVVGICMACSALPACNLAAACLDNISWPKCWPAWHARLHAQTAECRHSITAQVLDQLQPSTLRVLRLVCRGWEAAASRLLVHLRPEGIAGKQLASRFPSLHSLDLSNCCMGVDFTTPRMLRLQVRSGQPPYLRLPCLGCGLAAGAGSSACRCTCCSYLWTFSALGACLFTHIAVMCNDTACLQFALPWHASCGTVSVACAPAPPIRPPTCWPLPAVAAVQRALG